MNKYLRFLSLLIVSCCFSETSTVNAAAAQDTQDTHFLTIPGTPSPRGTITRPQSAASNETPPISSYCKTPLVSEDIMPVKIAATFPAKILLVDDLTLQRSFTMMKTLTLKNLGATTIDTAKDGLDALEKITKNGPYDLIIMDMDMDPSRKESSPIASELNGYITIKKIRSSEIDAIRLVPILGFSSDDDYNISLMEAGANFYVDKNASKDILKDAILRAIESSNWR